MEPIDISLRLLQFLGLIIPLTLLILEHTEEYSGLHEFKPRTKWLIQNILRKDIELVSVEVFILTAIFSFSISALCHLSAVFVSLLDYGNVLLFSSIGVVFSGIGIGVLCFTFYSILRYDLGMYS